MNTILSQSAYRAQRSSVHETGGTPIYLQGIDNTEIIDTVHARRAPMVPVHSSLRL